MVEKRIILSVVFAVVGYFLSTVSEATQDVLVITSYVTGGVELVCFLIAVPLAFSAGKIIRKELSTNGIPGIRFVSWIMYGVAIPHALLFFNWGLIAAGNNRIPNGQIPVNAAIFFIASMFMIAEVWNTTKKGNLNAS